ncbi:MAG: hypothetical protein QOJ99_3376 [Bryobacterales bacterium]|nr:hypothetical protein [Bryobacterales bacterium]
MRPRSITGPLILVGLGVIFLLNNLGHDLPLWSLFSSYWPVLLILIGVIGLVEVLYHVSRGSQVPPRPLAGGGWFWIVLVMFALWGSNKGNFHIGRLGTGGMTILGSDYDYDVNAASPSQGISRIVLDNIRGNLSLKGEDGGDVKVTGHKTVRAFNKTEADRGNERSQIRVERQGDLLFIRAEEPHNVRMLSVSTDLDVVIPKGVNVEARGRNGDLTIEDVNGSVDVSNGRGDVRLNNIGKDVKIESTRTGLVRATGVKGSLDLQGRGGEVQLEKIDGQVTINGEYSGTLEFRELAKPLHFTSQRSDFRAERVPGSITLDLGELKMNDVIGPVRFQTGSRDIQATDVTEALELTVDRGDIHVTQTKTPLPKMEIRSRNGDLTLSIPEKATFDLDGRTGQGEAVNDFGPSLEIHSEGRAATLKGRVGSGPRITLNTDRGSLTVRKN